MDRELLVRALTAYDHDETGLKKTGSVPVARIGELLRDTPGLRLSDKDITDIVGRCDPRNEGTVGAPFPPPAPSRSAAPLGPSLALALAGCSNRTGFKFACMHSAELVPFLKRAAKVLHVDLVDFYRPPTLIEMPGCRLRSRRWPVLSSHDRRAALRAPTELCALRHHPLSGEGGGLF